MRKKIILYVIWTIVMICLFIYGFSEKSNEITMEISFTAGGTILGLLLEKLFQYLDEIDSKLMLQALLNWNENIRISFAYLFRIQIDGKYFLIRGNKLNCFQPVGGVFQKYEGSKAVLRDIFQEEDEMKKGNEKDLRGKILGKDLKKLIEWFQSRQDREITCYREFKEELITSGILSKENFEDISYTYAGTHKTKIFTSECYGKEFLLAEIYDLELNDLQKQEFLNLKEKYDKAKDNSKLKYAFVSEQEIRKRRTDKRKEDNYKIDISNHTFKILKGEHKR